MDPIPDQAPHSSVLEQVPRSSGVEAAFLELERATPGFGGAYLSENGNIVAYSIHPTLDQAVNQALTERFLDGGDASLARPDGSRPRITIIRGSYSIGELVRWKQTLLMAAKEQPSMVLLDADERLNRVRIGISDPDAAEAVLEFAEDQGVPADAVHLVIMEGVFRHASNLRTTKRRPTVAGYQTRASSFGAGDTCSMGFSVRDVHDNVYYLTAGHCTGSFSGGTGMNRYQPGTAASDLVGEVHTNPAWSTSCSNPYATYCAAADVALVEYDGSVEASFKVAETTVVGTGNSSGNLTVGATYEINNTSNAWVGHPASKTGRTTGTTAGSVTGTCVSHPVAPPGGGFFYTVDCPIEAQMHSRAGDSGAPVFRYSPPFVGVKTAVGILFAFYEGGSGGLGSDDLTYFSEWQDIEAHLGMSLDPVTPPPPAPSAEISGPTNVKPFDYCTWQAVVTGGTPPYAYAWSGVLSGTGSYVSGSVSGSGWLHLSVTDDNSEVATTSEWITSSSSAPDCVF